MRQFQFRGSLSGSRLVLVSALCMGLLLPAAQAVAQSSNNALETVRPKIDWSGNQQNSEVNTASQQSRFDPISTIPESDNDNGSAASRTYVRDRGGVVPDRMQRRVQPARAGAINR